MQKLQGGSHQLATFLRILHTHIHILLSQTELVM